MSGTTDTIKDSLITKDNEGAPPKNQLKTKGRRRKQQTSFAQVVRFFNIIVAIGTVAFGIFCYIGFNFDQKPDIHDLSMFILPGYVAFSGLIILMIETECELVQRNMRFLVNYFGRGMFNIYVAVMCLAMVRDGQSDLFNTLVYVASALLGFFGICYVLSKLLCCAKTDAELERRERRRQLKEELEQLQD